MNVYSEEFILTSAVLPITCEATKTEAGMTAERVDTPGKLIALPLLCLTLIYI